MLQTTAVAVQPIALTPARSKDKLPGSKPAVACSSCCLQGVCLPGILSGQELERFGAVVTTKRRVARGASLYRERDRFEFLYAVRSGAFKTISVSRHGAEKVTGFHLAGELVGLEGIDAGRHGYTTVALEDSEVCAMQFAGLEKLAAAVPALQRQLFRALSSDISRDQGLMLLLGSMTAEQRLAAFLLSISRRYQRLGFAANSFVLRMTRAEIGSYLGLTLETVSRLFSRFQREGLLAVNQREVELYDTRTLREIVG
jgi:CRP/FNR family transcriptional regulator